MKQFRQIISTVLALVLLFSCAVCAHADAEDAASGGGPALNDGSPWVDYCLRENIVLVEGDPAASMDDFYLRVNYDWLRTAEIEPGSYSASAFADMENLITDLCLDVLQDTSLEGRDALTARQLYNAFLDWDARNTLGVAPVQNVLDQIKAVSTLDELTALFCREDYRGSQLFTFGAGYGFNDPETWLLYVEAPSLLLPDSAEYRERTELGNLYESTYRELMPGMLARFGYSPEESAGMLTRAFALEAELADSILTSAETMAPDYYQRINNEMSLTEAETLCTAFPWLTILDGQGLAVKQRCLVFQPAYLQKLDEVYREDRLDDLKNYLILKTIRDNMKLLDRESFDLAREIENRISGAEGFRPDEELACEAVRKWLPAQINNAFYAKHDAAKMKADLTRICEEAIDCYRRMLSEEDWLSEETRAKAIEKLDAMRIVAACPDKRADYSGLSLDGLGYFDCIDAIGRYETAIQAGLVDQPVDHELWYWTGESAFANDFLITNATYAPSSNFIVIMRGILGEPVYREDMSDEELYGAIGMIIGHEISHAFDPTGAQFDAVGRLSNWWTEADYAAFSERAEKLIDYYDAISVFGGFHVPGQNMQGEAIADIAGVKCMLRLLEEKKDSVDYRSFFESFARCFRSLVSPVYEIYALQYDSHPPVHIRINTVVQQFPQFYEAYGIEEGDGMFLAPEDRIQVW